MFSNHISQLVHLKSPEFPRVFTNFEDQVGEYSIAYKRAQDDLEIVAKVVKNAYNYVLVVRNKRTGVYDVIPFRTAYNITEDYGYKLNDCIKDKEVGDTIETDEFIYRSDNYDDDGNFSYGVNLKAIWLAYKNLTYEDGVVISESAAKKLTSYKVEKTMFTINGNDILLNLYGDEKNYKSFPKVGEHVDSKILVASRRREKRTLLYDLQSGRMMNVDPTTDDIIYTNGGMVTDIDVFCNIPLAELRKRSDTFNKEILDIVENNQRFWQELAAVLERIVPCKELSDAEKKKEASEFGHCCKHPIDRAENPNQYTNELAYWWKQAHENIDEKIQWRYDGKSFDNFKIQFTILKENPLMTGAKISGRYGNKGIVAKIVKDEEMPVTKDGTRAEILLNPLGVIGRLDEKVIRSA